MLKKIQIKEMFEHFHKLNPEPKGELYSVNSYTFLVAVALSAQATDIGVNKATRPLFSKIQTPEQMLDFGEENLREAIKTIGLYKTKAKNVITCAGQLVTKHNSQVPNDQKALEALAGVGRKTALVVRNQEFGEATIAVDTHIFRVSNRTGLAKGKTADEIADKLPSRIPQEYHKHAHHWLILHGRYICTARAPKCGQCPIAHMCEYKGKTGLICASAQ